MTAREYVILYALYLRNLTPDEFVSHEGVYVSSWAPLFTYLKRDGLIQRTGERRTTAHGRKAHVYRLTASGLHALGVVGLAEPRS